jgi:peptide/nickel transport system substrate-binding protein
MPDQQEKHRRSRGSRFGSVAAGTFLLALAAGVGCGGTGKRAASSSQPVVLRVGVNLTSGNPLGGIQQVAANQSFEGLIRLGPDGRPQTWLAKGWQVAPDQRSVTFQLRSDAKFSDGSAVDADTIVRALKENLPPFLGVVFDDFQQISKSADGRNVTVTFRRPSPLLVEAFEVSIRKPGKTTVGTGPFVLAGTASEPEIRANTDYYLGRPIIDRIVVTNFPRGRSAWAEMLRNNIDMLYDVGPDAAPSLQQATTVSTFNFTRPYQYVVALNVHLPKFKSAAIRRALNMAIDRSQLVHEGFEDQAIPSSGLVWPQNWALGQDSKRVVSNPLLAAETLKSTGLQFNCLVPTDYERIALVVQKQLAAVGVTMKVEAVAPDRAVQALNSSAFEAVILDLVGGPSPLRLYELWHSGGTIHFEGIGSAELDSTLDQIRHAGSEIEYRRAITNLQSVTIEDPPAIYLAWGQRARAVTKRFAVPPSDPGRDILATLRLWKPVTPAEQHATRN